MSQLPKRAPLRQEVQARFADGRAFNAPKGTPLEAFIQAADPKVEGRIVAVLMNGRLRELSHPLEVDADLVPVTTADSDGTRIYRRSLSFLMIAAAAEVWPDRTLVIQHSMPFGGYYCEYSDQQPIAETELKLSLIHI